MTYREMVDHYFFQLAEEEDIDRDALTAEQQLALTEAERQYDARLDPPHVEPVPHTEENVMGFYKDGGEWVPFWADNEPAMAKAHYSAPRALAGVYRNVFLVRLLPAFSRAWPRLLESRLRRSPVTAPASVRHRTVWPPASA